MIKSYFLKIALLLFLLQRASFSFAQDNVLPFQPRPTSGSGVVWDSQVAIQKNLERNAASNTSASVNSKNTLNAVSKVAKGHASVSRFMSRLNPYITVAFVAQGVYITYLSVSSVSLVGDSTIQSPAISQGQVVWRASGSLYMSNTREGAALLYSKFRDNSVSSISAINWGTPISCSGGSCLDAFSYPYTVTGIKNGTSTSLLLPGTVQAVAAPISCPDGTFLKTGNPHTCVNKTILDGYYQPTPVSYPDYHAALTSNGVDPALNLDPSERARIANNLWQAASSDPAYRGVPFNTARPVLPSDFMPGYSPTIGDLTSDYPDGNAVSNPYQNPDAVNQTPVDENGNPLEPDYQYEETPEPDLTPPDDLMGPLVNALVPVRDYVLNVRSVSCPTWDDSVSVSGYSFAIDISEHCNWLSQYYNLIFNVFLALWSISAFFIIMES